WLHLDAALGAALLFARLYGPRFGMPADSRLAYGDRWLPQLWASLGVAADVIGPLTVSVDALVRVVPSARFRADHVPENGALYPAFLTAHAFSSYGATAGLAWRF